MAIDIPPWLEPLLDFYGIPWPDVDEDAFHDLKGPLRAFGADLDAVGGAIDSALRTLEAGNPSRTLQSIVSHIDEVRRNFLDPIRTVCDDLAGAPCDIAYDAIVALKVSLLTALAAEVGNDVIDAFATVMTLGLDSALTVGEAIAVREMVKEMIAIGEAEVVNALLGAANSVIDNFVTSLISPFIDTVEHGIEGQVDAYLPMLVLETVELEESAAGRLHMSRDQLDSSVEGIVGSSVHLYTASGQLEDAIKEIFSHPADTPSVASLSSDLRQALKNVMDTVQSDFIDAIRKLVDHVIQHFVNLLEHFERALDDLDQQAAALARKAHNIKGAPVAVLSAAGTGAVAAEAVRYVSGVVNGEEAREVQVETVSAASAEGAVEEVVVAVNAAEIKTEAATVVHEVDELLLKGEASTVRVGPVLGSRDAGVETLQVHHEGDTAHAGLAQAGAGPASGVSGQHTDHPHVGVGTATTEGAAAQGHLHVKHPEGHGPHAATAETGGHAVNQVQASGKDQPRPVVDSSPEGSPEI